MLGPLYGGVIEAALGWRWLFWLNLPQVLIILPTVLLIPRQPPQPGRIDYLGGALLVAGLSLILVALSRSDVFEGTSATPYALAAVGLLMLAAMAWVEARTVQPLLPGVFFRSRAALSALGAKLLVGGGLIVAMVTVPLMANTVQEQEPLAGGLRLMRLTGALPVGAVIGGLLAHRLGSRNVTVPGLALAALGLYLMGQWGLDIADPAMSLHLALTGFGFGLVIAPLFLSAMEEGGDEYHATSASLVVVARMLGMAVGGCDTLILGRRPLPGPDGGRPAAASGRRRVHGRVPGARRPVQGPHQPGGVGRLPELLPGRRRADAGGHHPGVGACEAKGRRAYGSVSSMSRASRRSGSIGPTNLRTSRPSRSTMYFSGMPVSP